ncbi:amidohydrolase family protein [Spirillospora sp. CA-128828]|uniref:amidohydrolase family protein n=1 Tax=Spirillospora sp. CA-128828 TaxID=3240033 RepID=UPI003D907B5E
MSRIDVHQHLLPDAYVRRLNAEGIAQAGGRDLPAWSVEGAIALMDDHSIATGVLSLSTPGTHLGDDARALDLAREINDFGAELVKDRPDRFGHFATVPLPYVDGAVQESVRALDELGADGVVLLANSRGTYLGDPAFDPLMAELGRRSAVVLVHPAELPAPAVPGLPPFAADFLLDTTRAAANLVLHGIPRRHPGLKIILSHAGGFLPYAAHRIAVTLVGQGHDPGEVFEDLASFYFDTALSGSPAALPSLLAFARPGHVLFGSDWPFAPDAAVKYFTDGLDAFTADDEDLHQAIDSANALALFPRLAGH